MVVDDPNFYLLLSFVVFVGLGFVLLRSKIVRYLNGHIQTISRDLNHAACEKDKALLQFTQMNRTLGKLPQEIAKIWEEQVIDFTDLHAGLEQELRDIERRQAQLLADVQDLVIQKEVNHVLHSTALQFANDLQRATPEQQKRLIDQSLNLLDDIPLATPTEINRL